ncbi:MAG: hypothetical protein C0402_10340 [Thermodesulfovibrio sp.]|nr:hypothetical protein [Thermodesulfovibrio sp.]
MGDDFFHGDSGYWVSSLFEETCSIKGTVVTISVLIGKLAEKAESLIRTQTEIIVDTVLESMKQALLKGDKVEIRGFGNFRVKTWKARQARNPKRKCSNISHAIILQETKA